MFLLIRYRKMAKLDQYMPLHSTMFLLIRDVEPQIVRRWTHFTFHKVSINTLSPFSGIWNWIVFTFHNVSINTMVKISNCGHDENFTFHNVSINTAKARITHQCVSTLHSTMFLLIQAMQQMNQRLL